MGKQTGQKGTSLGTCRFCEGEFTKSKMTQHLKACKARLTSNAEPEGRTQRLLHLVVEGIYRPSYWMHLELPATTTLEDLDDFLRAIWLECCGHLSEFTIKGLSYSAAPEDDWDGAMGGLLDEEDEEVDEEGGPDQGLPALEAMTSQISENLSHELHADLKDVSISQIENKLAEMLSENMPPGMPALTSPEFRPFLNYMATTLQQGTLASEIAAMEQIDGEQSMDVALGEVVAVGENFSYVYDFGSSTNLSLRVIAEREGALPAQLMEEEERADLEDGEDFAIVVMARNNPPDLLCHLCGKPATYVRPESEYETLDEAGLCESCAQEQSHPDELLPVVNSPRVGVCGYTGGDDIGEEDWEEWDDE